MAAFQYQSLDMRNEAIDSILSDVVTKILYLAPNYACRPDGGELPRTSMNSSLIKAEMLKKMIKNKKPGAGLTLEKPELN
jgi:hypothetical protein